MTTNEAVQIIMLVKRYDIDEGRRLLVHALCPWWELPALIKADIGKTPIANQQQIDSIDG